MDRIPIDKIETVCTECYRIVKRRAPLTCPTCGGRIIRVLEDQGQAAVKELKARGHSSLAI